MFGQRKRFTEDVRRWRGEGWVTPDGEAKILAELASSRHGIGLASALGILASVLLGFAAISFVAAHWEDMPRIMRLGLLLTLIWVSYGAAGVFETRGQRMFADAAILFAVAIFGANIMLISQMFHIDGNPPDGILLWFFGALLAGVLLRSNAALAFAMVLAAFWSSLEMKETDKVHWPFLLAWGAVTAAFVWQRWKPGAHLSGIAIAGFVISLGYTLANGHQHSVVVLLGLVGVALSIAVATARPEFDAITSPALGYSIATAFAGFLALQFVEDPANVHLVLLAALALSLLLAAIWYGMAKHHRGALWLGYIGFSIEILSVYWKTVGTILDTSLFFLVAGVIVAGLAYMAWRIASRTETQGLPA